MSVTAQQLDKAFEEFQQFGPRRRIPVEERWREILPDVSPTEYPGLLAQCKDIETVALSLAEQVRNSKLDDLAARQMLTQRFPSLTQARQDHTWSQAMYFAFRE